jgi:hypothetical protein
MPGPVSDSYDPEWGTSAVGSEIDDNLEQVYDRLTGILGGKPPIDIRKLIRMELPRDISATMTEKEWRLIRFAIERARDSL